MSCSTAGYFKVIQIIDPVGRTTSFAYSNHIDLAAISQTTAYGVQQTIAQFIYSITVTVYFSRRSAHDRELASRRDQLRKLSP